LMGIVNIDPSWISYYRKMHDESITADGLHWW
jgi:hypothetical protein